MIFRNNGDGRPSNRGEATNLRARQRTRIIVIYGRREWNIFARNFSESKIIIYKVCPESHVAPKDLRGKSIHFNVALASVI